MPCILAVETSCDETSVALARDGRVLANIVSSQIQTHAEYGGVVPELAVREHLRSLPPLFRAALAEAKVPVSEIDAVAATRGPGLPTALLTGLKAAQGFAFAIRKPFLGVNHHEAHLYSAWLRGNPPQADFAKFQPNVSLIVSGGHTMLVWVRELLRHELLGSTVDDAAGECFDKVAKLLGLPYPGGPEIDRLAAQGNPEAFAFPRPMLGADHHDFSFSGLKTSVRYFLQKHPHLVEDTQAVKDICASVQQAIVETLAGKAMQAVKQTRVRCLTVSGGVACNRGLRAALQRRCAKAGLELLVSEPRYCTDNAAMIAVLAELQLAQGRAGQDLDSEIDSSWRLPEAVQR